MYIYVLYGIALGRWGLLMFLAGWRVLLSIFAKLYITCVVGSGSWEGVLGDVELGWIRRNLTCGGIIWLLGREMGRMQWLWMWWSGFGAPILYLYCVVAVKQLCAGPHSRCCVWTLIPRRWWQMTVECGLMELHDPEPDVCESDGR